MRALLFGLGIENACKARLIRTGMITVQNGVANGLGTDHNVLEMVKDAQYSPNAEEAEFLKLLGYQTRVLAKYPIARNLDTQNEFTGRCIGARASETQLVHHLIKKVLVDGDLVDSLVIGIQAKS